MMPTQTILNNCQQELAGEEAKAMKMGKAPKVRRSRQPKNPQLSVARRNERERNRVKMVNNGFALLREHLPIEDLQECSGGESGCDTPTPEGAGPRSQRAKKYSKVETLRAAIQRIRMLEELIRATEPGFESINLMPSSNANSYDDEPLSCGSSSTSPTTTATTTTVGSGSCHQQQMAQIQMAPASNQHFGQQLYATNQGGQFIKLEPAASCQQAAYSYSQQMPSPQDSLASRTSQPSHQTQVHQSSHQLATQYPGAFQPEEPSHTHLWLQQHQSSFMEQTAAAGQDWYQQQQQQQAQFQQQQPAESPEAHHQLAWYQQGGSPAAQMGQSQATFQQQQQHHNQVSLYSQ